MSDDELVHVVDSIHMPSLGLEATVIKNNIGRHEFLDTVREPARLENAKADGEF